MADELVSRTVQEYIDELPRWADGTLVSTAPMTAMQWRIWWLAAAGKFFEGLVVFITGVALPLIALNFQLDATQKGMTGSVALFGILIGATALGGLADRFGRKVMFIVEMALFVVFLALVAVSPSFTWFVVCMFGVGLSLGCDYPTAHVIISESIPSAARGRLVLSAFGFQALGALAGPGLGLLILQTEESVADWRWMYASAIIPAALVLAGRFFIPQSGHWLVAHGRFPEAERETEALLHREPPYPRRVHLTTPRRRAQAGEAPRPASFFALFAPPNRRATILAAAPWFIQDLGTYGIGIFTPLILASTIGATTDQPRNLAEVIHNDVLAARGAALLDALLIVGMAGAVLLADRVGRIRLQIFGFFGCALGLLLAALAGHFQDATKVGLIFAGFMIFNFMTNLGPNAMTYLIAGEVFPTRIRGVGAGFAASFAKIGAVLTTFFFPILLNQIGTSTLLYLLTAASLLGAFVTWHWRIETTGVNLETVGMEPKA